MIIQSILVVIEALVSLLLVGIILLQKSKSEGLGLAFGSGMGESLFGSRTGNVLTKATVILGVVFMANTIALAMVYSGKQSGSLMQEYDNAQGGRPPMRAPSTAAPMAPAGIPEGAPAGVAPTLPGGAAQPVPEMPETTVQIPVAAQEDAPADMPASPAPDAAGGASAEN